MTMNSSGAISLGGATAGQSINLENGQSATATVSLNDSAVRTLAGVPSGAIVMPTNFYGKSNTVALSYTFTSSTVNASLNIAGISGYVAGKSAVTVTANSGVYLWANSTSNYGLSLTGGTTGDTLTLVNNGFIMGQGGNGWGTLTNVTPNVGGSALNIPINTTITNTSGYIGGGGGGGQAANYQSYFGGGGGAGGGSGGVGNIVTRDCCCHPVCDPVAGGTAGSIGASGGNSTYQVGCYASPGTGGGGGGRIMPGTGGTSRSNNGGYAGTGGGAGGSGGGKNAPGGSGGSAGSAGGNGIVGDLYGTSGGGGGYGASGGGGGGGNGSTYLNGYAGGKAVNLNGKTVTWTGGSASSSRAYGAVS